MLVDSSRVAADALPPTLKTSKQASILMADDASSSMDATTGTASASSVSTYQTGTVALLCERVFAAEPVRDEGVVALCTGIDYSPVTV